MLTMVRGLTLFQGVGVAVVLAILALFVLRRGLLNTLAWIGALLALGIGVINYLSYGR